MLTSQYAVCSCGGSLLLNAAGRALWNYCLFTISVNSEVSNEVEVTPGVHIRALRAAPVGPCYTNYLKWFQLLIRWSYKIIG